MNFDLYRTSSWKISPVEIRTGELVSNRKCTIHRIVSVSKSLIIIFIVNLESNFGDLHVLTFNYDKPVIGN